MRSMRCHLHRAAIGLLVATVAGLSLAGCSVMGPEDLWSANPAEVVGKVYSTAGSPVGGVEVYLWAAQDAAGRAADYEASTCETGYFTFPDLRPLTPDAYQEVYEIYINRTRDDDTPIRYAYETYESTVTIEPGETALMSVVLGINGGEQPVQSGPAVP